MKQLRYQGEFRSREAVLWRVELLQDGDWSGPVGELEFSGDEPLVIEWPSADKEEPVCGSLAVLRVLSPGDRTYEDLYTIRVGAIRLDVYREGVLYWSGTLDPEFYEEPYSTLADYEVSLTFSDFGILDRLPYSLSGLVTLRAIVDDALGKSGMSYGGIDEGLITTYVGGRRATLEVLSVMSENFFDEDGEACTLREVLEGVLQPLGLKMVQRSGKVWLYDLNGLYEGGSQRQITWMSTDQMMGTDKVVNNVKVTFSAYGRQPLLSSDADCNTGADAATVAYYPFYTSLLEDADNVDFFLHLSPTGGGVASTGYGYFKMESVFGSADAKGVVGGIRLLGGMFGGSTASAPVWRQYGRPFDSMLQDDVLVSHRVRLCKLSAAEVSSLYLRLSLELLVDGRYNPFSNSEDNNCKKDQATIDEDWSYLFVPVSVVLYDDDGQAKQHWNNFGVSNSRDGQPRFGDTTGTWQAGAGSWGEAWLEYYDADDRKHSSGTGGWHTNLQSIGMTNKELLPSLKRRKEGQYIPYPADGGLIEVRVYGGLWPYEDINTSGLRLGSSRHSKMEAQLREKVRWCLYKAPMLEVVDTSLKNDTVECDDVEYTGVINADAKDDLELETICGTTAAAYPTALGLYVLTADGSAVHEMTRAGRTTQAEQLLIGTLCSQYGGRRTTLSGTTRILADGLSAYTEGMQGDKKFVLLSDVEDVAQDESEIIMAELRPDEYTD